MIFTKDELYISVYYSTGSQQQIIEIFQHNYTSEDRHYVKFFLPLDTKDRDGENELYFMTGFMFGDCARPLTSVKFGYKLKKLYGYASE